MKHWILMIGLSVLLGCQPKGPTLQKVVAQVGPYTITQNEFEEAYRESAYAKQDTPSSRQAFLDHLIDQKLILLDAQRQGLDKDPRFLGMVESFWQQSLLTVALQQKTKEGTDLDQWVAYLKNNTKVEINGEYLK